MIIMKLVHKCTRNEYYEKREIKSNKRNTECYSMNGIFRLSKSRKILSLRNDTILHKNHLSVETVI